MARLLAPGRNLLPLLLHLEGQRLLALLQAAQLVLQQRARGWEGRG